MASQKRKLGDGAEQHVARYMKSLGYTILSTNYNVPKIGEIDIVARYEDNIYFVEVKARSNPNPFGGMEGCISYKKLMRIRQSADIYLQHNKVDAFCKVLEAFVHITPQSRYERIDLIPID